MIRVVNSGNVPLSNVSVKDPLTGMDRLIALLMPGVTETFYTEYTITPADEARGRVDNTAIASGPGLRTDIISDNDIATIQVASCELVIPNGFSPNGDGIQDYWRIKCLEKYPDAKVEIYNRWGNLVYELEHYGNLDVHGPTDAWWNGYSTSKWTFGTDKLPTGTYFYILDLKDGSKPRNGFIFLNR
jgi:gliding motility-associated-like protein